MRGAPRAALLQVINDYLAAAQTEKSVSTISVARQRAARVSEAAQTLLDVLSEGDSTHAEITAVDYVNVSIEEYFAAAGHRITISTISDIVGDLVAGAWHAERALDQLVSAEDFAPGSAWNEFVVALARRYEAMTGEKATARGDNMPTRFSRWLQSIQRQLPPEFREHENSDAAFNSALIRALLKRVPKPA